ncbi:MAG: hypothetical protein AAGK04_14600, partial [Planctomycetota bacterium]
SRSLAENPIERDACDAVRRVFSRRLARIARIHNRAKPVFDTLEQDLIDPLGPNAGEWDSDEWTPDRDEEQDDWGMAA